MRTDKICGHERETLRWALELPKHPMPVFDSLAVSEARRRAPTDAHVFALNAIHDPAQRSAILVSLVRSANIDANMSNVRTQPWKAQTNFHVYYGFDNDETIIHRRVDDKWAETRMYPDKCRAFILALLDSRDVKRTIGELA